MRTFPPNRSTTAALTLPEVAITVGVILILALILVPAFWSPSGAKPRSARTACVNNLKQIGLAFRIWANDSRDGFPMAYADKFGGAKDSIAQGKIARVFQIMSNELVVPKTVICPADTRVAATNWNDLGNAHVSYFVGLDAEDTRSNMLLAGDRNLALNSRLLTGIAALGTNSPLTWTKEIHQEAGNIALADGSVMQVTTAQLRQQLAKTGDTTNRVLFPQ
jgi:prepilin-type processing-associated H-X9-DG protein